MKANESVKNYESTRRMYANYAARSIKKVCKEIGPRFSGTEAEKKSIEYMAEDMKTCCNDVKIDSYTVHPKAFLGWIPFSIAVMTVSCILFFVAQFFAIAPIFYASLALTVICLFFIVTEFLFYKETLDPFCPKKTSHNAYGVRKPSGEVKRRIIFCGHADSSMEWRFTYWGGSKLVIPVIGGSFIGLIAALVFNIIAIVMTVKDPGYITSNPLMLDIFSYILFGFNVIFLVASLFYDKKRIVEGANDNLTGCFTSIGILKFLEDNGIQLENTEVIALCSGSEEIGLRGTKDFCKKHGSEFKDVETAFIAIDTLRDFEYMSVYNKDMTGLVKNDADVCKLIKDGAKIAGYDVPYKTVSLGATDAAAATQGGMKAAAFAAMDPTPARYYHTRLDTHENLDLKTIEASLDICLETLFLYDEKGFNA